MNNQNNSVIITLCDLPLHCSGPEYADSWNGYPCVSLPIQSDGDIGCPYCGTYYHLEGKIYPHHYQFPGAIMNKHAVVLLPLLLPAVCGPHRAVRPSVQTPVVAESQTYSVNYKAAKDQRIIVVYINGSSPMTVELCQGNMVEKLKQARSRAKGVEYSNLSTRWYVQEGLAMLRRKNKQTMFTEIIE